MNRSVTSLVVVAAVALAAASCSSSTPINPDDLADRIAADSREMVHQSGGGIAFTQASDSGLKKISTALGDASSGVAGNMPATMPPGMMSAMAGSPLAAAMGGMPSMMTTEEQFDDTADQLKTWLRERLLADANLESKSDDEAVYLLHADPTCRALPKDGDPAGTLPAINSHCADQLTRLEVRVALRADGDGGRLTILIGPNRLEMSSFIVHSNSLALELDLAKAYAADKVIRDTLGTDSPTQTKFDALTGKLRLSLTKNGEKSVTGAFAIVEPLDISTLDANGGLGAAVKLAASDPTFAVTADGVMQTLAVKVAMGALDVAGDWDPKGMLPPNRDLHVAVGGVFSETTFREGDDTIKGQGVGFAPSEVDVRGAHIYDVAFNRNDGNRFDYTLSLDGNGHPQVALTPRFDLSIGAHAAAVAADFSTPPPSYTLDETYRIDFEGGGAPAGFVTVPASGTFTGGLKITAGALTFSTTSTPDTVVVPAGKCLTGVSTAPAGTHPLLGRLVVSDCP